MKIKNYNMEYLILFDPTVGTTNKGDDIIMRGVYSGLKEIMKDRYVIHFPTHTTPFSIFQNYFWWKAKFVKNADLKFVCGTNLLAKNMRYPVNNWNINLFNSKPLVNSILVGVGNSLLNKKSNIYTRKLYKRVLNKEYFHSVRDDSTKEMLESMGYKAITTGCPTLWGITPEIMKQIPEKKAESVVMTVTGSDRDPIRDQIMLNICRKNYSKRFLWLQTIHDLPYLKTLQELEDVEIISPDLDTYKEFLETHNVDYVGTRLHGGIFAMQHKKRSIIIAIDNRATNINKVNNLNCIQRNQIETLDAKINSDFKTKLRIDFLNIEKWKNQFNK